MKLWLIDRWKILLAVAALTIGFGSLAQGITQSQDYMLNRDFFSFWLAGRMILNGQDPYSSTQWIAGHVAAGSSWIENLTFVYPLPLAFLLAPFGSLPLERAVVLWDFLTSVFLLVSMLLLMSTWKSVDRIRIYLLPGLMGLLVFRPVVTTLLHGQFVALWVLTLSLCIFWWKRGKWLPGGLALALLALKPSIGVPLIGLIGLWLIFNRRWSTLGAAGLSGLALLIVGWIYNPAWVQEFVGIANQKLSSTFGYSPTIWGVTAVVCQHGLACVIGSSVVLGLLLVAGCLILLARPEFKADPALAISCIVPVVLLITPYLWVYDQILLLIPLLAVMRSMLKRGRPYVQLALLFPAMAILSWLLVIVAQDIGSDAWSSLVPIICLTLLLAFNLVPSKPPVYIEV